MKPVKVRAREGKPMLAAEIEKLLTALRALKPEIAARYKARQTGASIHISIPDMDEEETVWREAARQYFFEAYDNEDSIYDRL